MRKLIPPIAGTVVTVAFELSVERGWFESVPDTIIACLWFLPVALWVYWFYTHEEIQRRKHLVGEHIVVSLVVFVLLGGVLGAAAGALGWWSLKRQHERAEAKVTSSSESLSPSNPQLNDGITAIERRLVSVPDVEYRRLVASTIYALDPEASLSVGALEPTPDGARLVDVELRNVHDGVTKLTAIDVLNFPLGKKGDISVVDAADSKRTDIHADTMLLCSNTGFTDEAISKAKRKGIGLISVLHQGDTRVGAIEEEIFLRKIDINPVDITYNYVPSAQTFNFDASTVEYMGGSIMGWLRMKAAVIAMMNPSLTTRYTRVFTLKEQTPFYSNGRMIMFKSLSVSFTPHVTWLSQTVRIDAAAGIFDYVRGKVRLAPGANSYIISGVDFNSAKLLPMPPPQDVFFGVGLRSGEVDMTLVHVIGLPENGTKIADLDHLVVPEDLDLRISAQ